jgi:transposase
MKFFAGIDLGKRKSHIKIIDENRKVIEDLKIDNDPKAFLRIFRKYKGNIEVALEASSNAFWVWDTLSAIAPKCSVGHTSKIRWIAEARIKTDKIDAGILAELIRVDLFPAISVPPRRIRELRELVRGIVRLRRQIVRYRNQVHGLLGRHGVPYKRSEVQEAKLGQLVRQTELPKPARATADAFLKLESAAGEEARRLELDLKRELKDEADIRNPIDLLESIPGVGFFSAALWVLELWDVTRFEDANHLASYIGFVPGTYQTGETMRHGGMTRRGNVLLRWILVQNAWSAIHNHWFFGRVYERYKRRKGNTRGVVPVARALLKTIHRVWTEKKRYDELYKEKALVG